MHAIGFAFILPFLPKYLMSIMGKASEADIGYGAGVVEAAYSVAMLLLLYPAGLASDKYGRKPVLLAALAGCTIFSSIFGLGRSLVQLVLLRLVLGASIAGLPATVMTMLMEISTSATSSLAFSLNGTAWALGSVIAPMIGGLLANPASTWDGLKGTIFDRYPYVAPGIAVSVITMLFICMLKFTDHHRPVQSQH